MNNSSWAIFLSRKTFFVFSIFLISCSNSNSLKERELDLREKELVIKEKELEIRKNKKDTASIKGYIDDGKTAHSDVKLNPVPIRKYIYCIFKTSQPTLVHEASKTSAPSSGIFSEVMPNQTLLEFNYADLNYYIYTTDVREIEDYNDDKKYSYLDEMEKKVEKNLEAINREFELDVLMQIRDVDEQNKLKRFKARITNRTVKTFDTYSEASVDRNRN